MGANAEYDIVIVGAGPHALSLLTRLLVNVQDKYEERPNNQKLFSRNSEGKLLTKVKDNPQMQRTPRQITSFLQSKQKENAAMLSNICIIDIHGCWMSQWAKQFDVLGISHLRSTSSVHPDAFDLQSLTTFTKMQKRDSEMLDISRNIRGSKFSGPFIIPSTSLFWDFCALTVHNYCLDNCVKQGKVLNIFKHDNDGDNLVYKLRLDTGEVVGARNVVVATGNTTKRIPSWAEDIYAVNTDGTFLHSSDLISQCSSSGIMSTSSLNSTKFSEPALSPVDLVAEGESVAIIGGGLTSGHLAIKVALSCAKEIFLVCRSIVKVRQFDLSLDWIGRGRFKKLAEYFSMQDYKERFDVLTAARNGGSITPSVHTQLLKLVDEGLLEIFEETEVWACEQLGKKWNLELSSGELLLVDRIILATGSAINSMEDPILSQLHKMHGVNTIGGLPTLTEDLEWFEGSGLFVMGPYAALQLGPDALNIAGARGGASRIAHKLKKSLSDS